MKYIKNINEGNKVYDYESDEYLFNTSDYNNTVTFYLHKDKQGFVLEVAPEDRKELERILTKNKVNYSVDSTNVLPF